MRLNEAPQRKTRVLPTALAILAVGCASGTGGFLYGKKHPDAPKKTLVSPQPKKQPQPSSPDSEIEKRLKKCRVDLGYEQGKVALLEVFLNNNKKAMSSEEDNNGANKKNICEQAQNARDVVDCHSFSDPEMGKFYDFMLGTVDAKIEDVRKLTDQECRSIIFFANKAELQRQGCLDTVARNEADKGENTFLSKPPTDFKEKYGTEGQFSISTRPAVIECTSRYTVPTDAGGANADDLLKSLFHRDSETP